MFNPFYTPTYFLLNRRSQALPIKKLTFIGIVLLFCGCNARTIPAPVVDINTGISIAKKSTKKIKSKSYRVKKGETLYAIAWRANVNVNTLAKVNKIRAPYHIYPGQKILISEKTTQPSKNKGRDESLQNKQQKSLKKAIAPIKKQEYGRNISSEKIESNQKVRLWKWPASGKIISTYSSAKLGNKGIDIAGKRGDSVKATANGKVVYAGNALRGYGNLVIVKHNEDYLSAYAHNDVISVKEGQVVKAGQTIAKMGNTGTQRTMLHFEVRFRGKSVNPLKFLPKYNKS